MSDQGRARRRGNGLNRRARLAYLRTGRLPAAVRGMLWSALAGVCFILLNTLMRALAIELHPFQAQFLRYLFGVVVMLPLVWHSGIAAYRPNRIGGQFMRGGVHSLGLFLWFLALPRIPLADMVAIGFTGPIFVMLGAWIFLREPMRWERWVAALIGLGGVMIVLAPKAFSAGGGFWHLVMLASAPLFAASFLLTKTLTRHESTEVIVIWQALSVMIFSTPLALYFWQWPSATQWFGFLLCGLLGSAGHFCLTRSFHIADISSTQSLKFLELVWASALGWLIFSDTPSRATLIGGVVICASTLWIAHRESRRRGEPVIP